MKGRSSLGLVLLALFGVLLVVILGQGAYTAVSLKTIDRGSRLILTKRIKAFEILGQMNADFGDIRVAQNGLLDSTGGGRDHFQEMMRLAEAKMAKDISLYAPLVVDKEDIALFGKIQAAVTQSHAIWGQVQSLLDAGKREAALQLFLGDGLDAYNKAGSFIQAAVDDITQNVDSEGKANLGHMAKAEFIIYIAIALSVVIGLVALLVTVGYVVRPLKRVTGAMTALAQGNVETAVPGLSRRDEIGAMAAALQVFKEGILRNRALEAQADAAREQAAAERVKLQEAAEEAAGQRLRQATMALATGLRRLAGGDLSFELTEPFSAEFESLRIDLNAAVAQLSESVAAVAVAAGSIGQGSQEVSRSADDLSRRTEQQAASLEQTAAALQEITGNVGTSTKRVEEARAVSQAASISAGRSSEVMQEAVLAMQQIEESSRQITNIIGVIDEIAFQTNLLALNAGVEAARAGEAGRGFAVVATEVRALAQRSAEAAREIKVLIGSSSIQVEKGVTLVRNTGDALLEIQQHVTSINTAMEAITQAARQQSTGLAEVNAAVRQMDDVTQKNAAMVEETNAASTMLASDSRNLLDVVGRFTVATLDGTAAASRHAA